MHSIEPFYRWESQYRTEKDPRSPFFRNRPDRFSYQNAIYSYYIHPDWDFIGSETLYMKLLYTDYSLKFTIFEMMGEWNDTLHNDVMYLKRNIVDALVKQGIHKFIVIGENVLNFHGSDDCYYEEWFEDVEDGWIVFMNFRAHVSSEMSKYGIDHYIISGGSLDDFETWRTMQPQQVYFQISEWVQRRIALQ